jgi:ABC-type branched-subunit amino acid transport system permease subunit
VNPDSNLGANMQGIIFGALLILTMLFAPSGIAGLWGPIRRLTKSRRRLATNQSVQ